MPGQADLIDTPLEPFLSRTWSAMLKAGSVEECASGDILHREGVVDDRLIFVLSGKVTLERRENDRDWQVGIYKSRGETLSNSSLHLSTPKMFTMRVTEPGTTVLVLSKEAVYKLCQKHEDFLLFLLQDISLQVGSAIGYLSQDRELPAEKRIAHRLLELSSEGDIIKLTQAEIGALLGTSRITVSKCLAVLEGKGLIDRLYGGIRVNDADGLREWSQSR